MATLELPRQLANEVERARMWRHIGGDDETGIAKCHERINALLDRWEAAENAVSTGKIIQR